jgi:hypothetical protein
MTRDHLVEDLVMARDRLGMAIGAFAHSRAEPSMSVIRNVTVPAGTPNAETSVAA